MGGFLPVYVTGFWLPVMDVQREDSGSRRPLVQADGCTLGGFLTTARPGISA